MSVAAIPLLLGGFGLLMRRNATAARQAGYANVMGELLQGNSIGGIDMDPAMADAIRVMAVNNPEAALSWAIQARDKRIAMNQHQDQQQYQNATLEIQRGNLAVSQSNADMRMREFDYMRRKDQRAENAEARQIAQLQSVWHSPELSETYTIAQAAAEGVAPPDQFPLMTEGGLTLIPTRNSDAWKETQAALAGNQRILSAINNAIAAVEDAEDNTLADASSAVYGLIRGLRGDAILAMRAANPGMGPLDEGTERLMNMLFPDPTSLRTQAGGLASKDMILTGMKTGAAAFAQDAGMWLDRAQGMTGLDGSRQALVTELSKVPGVNPRLVTQRDRNMQAFMGPTDMPKLRQFLNSVMQGNLGGLLQ